MVNECVCRCFTKKIKNKKLQIYFQIDFYNCVITLFPSLGQRSWGGGI